MSDQDAVVIVGASLAGSKVAENLRIEGFDGPIRLIGKEPHLPYQRPPLSKSLLQGTADLTKPRVLDDSYYAANEVDLLLGIEAVAVDLAGSTVELAGGRKVGFGTLVLATGSSVRHLTVPGSDLAGIHYLRTLDDSLLLRDALMPGRRLVVIGGSWIGTEVAASARIRGVEVVMIDRDVLPLHHIFGPEMGAFFADLHRGHGVDIRPQAEVERIEGDKQVEAVVLKDGSRIEADLVVAGIGVTPNVGLAVDAGLTVDNGVLVDDHLRTSHPSVYAIGDIANQLHPILQQRVRVEHWSNALNQGIATGRNIAGNDNVYQRVPFFYSDQYDMGMEYAGWPVPWGRMVFRGDPADGKFLAFFMDGDHVVGGANVNLWDINPQIQALIRTAAPVEDEALADPGVDLAGLAG
jgi:3-phenylpropionate/trans-cinnamate dioxygenase ferredoxin reductase subunit